MLAHQSDTLRPVRWAVRDLHQPRAPNGLRLSGERSRAERVRCSRGLGGNARTRRSISLLTVIAWIRARTANRLVMAARTLFSIADHLNMVLAFEDTAVMTPPVRPLLLFVPISNPRETLPPDHVMVDQLCS